MTRFFQKFSRLSVPPNSVVKIVESASRMCPARSLRWHPDEGIELRVARLGERMRSIEVNGLSCQHMNGFRVFGGQRVMRQMGMEVEGGDTVQQTALVQVLVIVNGAIFSVPFTTAGRSPY